MKNNAPKKGFLKTADKTFKGTLLALGATALTALKVFARYTLSLPGIIGGVVALTKKISLGKSLLVGFGTGVGSGIGGFVGFLGGLVGGAVGGAAVGGLVGLPFGKAKTGAKIGAVAGAVTTMVAGGIGGSIYGAIEGYDWTKERVTKTENVKTSFNHNAAMNAPTTAKLDLKKIPAPVYSR